jgi:SAM-dependent methyltransferase
MGEFADSKGYERLMGRWSRALGPEFVRFAGLGPRGRVLDLGCGTGSLAAAILASGPATEVVGVDPSPDFVHAARTRVAGPRARFETGDAQRLPFDDGVFDGVMSMLVLNFVPDRARAMAEARRVTCAGGCVAACVWDYAGEMAMLREFWDAAVALDPSAAPKHEGRMPLSRRGELEALWRSAGLEQVREDAITISTRFESFDDYWQPFLSGVGPSGSYAAALPPERRRALEARLLERLWNGRPDESRTLPARVWAVAGTAAASD